MSQKAFNLPSLIFIGIVIALDIAFIRWAIGGGYQSTDQLTFFVLAGLLSALNLLIAYACFYAIAAFKKGVMRIETRKRIYNYGEEISGKIYLTAKRPLEVSYLRLTLSASVKRRRNDKTYTDVIWQNEVSILENTHISPGNREFRFSVTLPEEQDAKQGEAYNLLGQLVASAIQERIIWQLYAAVEVPGVDIHASESVQVNDGQFL